MSGSTRTTSSTRTNDQTTSRRGGTSSNGTKSNAGLVRLGSKPAQPVTTGGSRSLGRGTAGAAVLGGRPRDLPGPGQDLSAPRRTRDVRSGPRRGASNGPWRTRRPAAPSANRADPGRDVG